MDIDEVKARRHELQNQMTELVREFEEETGVEIDAIYLDRIEIYSTEHAVGGGEGESILHEIRAELRI